MTREEFRADLAWRTRFAYCDRCGAIHERCTPCEECCWCGLAVSAHRRAA